MTINTMPSTFDSLKLDLRVFKPTRALRSKGFHDSLGSAEFNVYAPPVASSASFRSKAMPEDIPVAAAVPAEKKRTVQFQVNAQDEIITSVQTFERYTDEELQDVFWSPAMRTEFITNARYDCDDVALDESDLLVNLDEIYGEDEGHAMEEDEKMAIDWCSSTGRGLESAVLSSVRRFRRKHNKAVLKCQEKHMNKGGTLDSLSKLLRKQSLKSSKKGAYFASLMAAGDSFVSTQDESDISARLSR